MTKSLGISQLSLTLIQELNKLSNLDYYLDVIVFYSRYEKLIKANYFAMLQEKEVWGFNAPVMATDLDTARILLSCPIPTKKLFYVWDLEWIHKTYDVNYLLSIYCHPDIHLLARSESHAKIIEKCFKKPIDILEDFNYERFASIISQ